MTGGGGRNAAVFAGGAGVGSLALAVAVAFAFNRGVPSGAPGGALPHEVATPSTTSKRTRFHTKEEPVMSLETPGGDGGSS
jgi:hypothetical protein